MTPTPITFIVPAGTPERRCNSCGAPIYWITTPKGKRMPIDCLSAIVGGTMLPRAPTTRDEGRGQSHFATCPNADQHRRK